MSDLLVIVPTRGRPESVARIVEAWQATGAFDDGAELLFAWDRDDPRAVDYVEEFDRIGWSELHRSRFRQMPRWQPLVPKLNSVAVDYAGYDARFALAFMGDDHRPRTTGWASAMLAALRDMGSGIVYGDDLLQGERLCTSWAMTSDIVRALGRMVPAPVEHMYCDNSVMDLGRLAGCLRYLPDVVIEHCHPLAGKAQWDVGYARVNRTEQYRRDEVAYRRWVASDRDSDVAAVKALRGSSVDAVRNPD